MADPSGSPSGSTGRKKEFRDKLLFLLPLVWFWNNDNFGIDCFASMLENSRNRIKLLSNILIIGFPLIFSGLIGFFFFCGGIGGVVGLLFLVMSVIFTGLGVRIKKNLKNRNRFEVQSLIVFVLIISALPCFLFSDGNYELIGILYLLFVIAFGYFAVKRIKKTIIKLEIVSLITFVFLITFSGLLISFLYEELT